MNVTFKAAGESDIEHLLNFVRDFHTYGRLPFDYQIARSALEKLVSDDSLGYAWMIYCDEVAVGYAILTLGYSLEYHGRDAFVDELYVKESHRRRGIGTRTLQFLTDTCRSIGVNVVHLEVDRDDTAAQAFYRNASFEDHDRYLMTKWVTR